MDKKFLDYVLTVTIYNALSATLTQLKVFPSSSDLQTMSQNVLNYVWQNYMTIKTPEALLFYYIDIVFSPKLILRHLLVISVLQFSVMSSQTVSNLWRTIYQTLTKKGRQIKQIRKKLETSKSYEVWKSNAQELDKIHGLDKWRKEDVCQFYDHKVVRTRIMDSADMMRRGDVFNLIFRLRGGLARDQFGIQHEGLFTKALTGTKAIVEEYHDTVQKSLNFICDSPIAEEIPSDAKLAFFNETRHAYGRTALLLSGGAYLGFYHFGVLRALVVNTLLPRVISGSSAGSLSAAVIGTRTDEELSEILGNKSTPESRLSFKRNFFTFSTVIKSETGRLIQQYTPKLLRPIVDPILTVIFDKKVLNLDTEAFKNEVMNVVGTMTFQEAFDRTGRIINITVAPLNNYDPPRLLNYLTAPHVCVWSAAAASCALPGIFDSFTLIVKEPNGNFSPENVWTRQGHTEHEVSLPQGYSDGSLESDLPMKQLSELFNVNHFIISQANPHSALLSSLSLQSSVWSPPLYGAIASYVRFLKTQCKDWLKNVITLLVSRSLAPAWSTKRGVSQVLIQEYEGTAEDITIFPWVGHLSVMEALMSIIKNPSSAEFIDIIAYGEAAMWPYIARIKANCMVEITLDKCVQKLRRQIAEEDYKLAAASGGDPQQRVNSSGRGKLDRTPSFYTSRSIVHLSGLSVADPLPPSLQNFHQPLSLNTSHLQLQQPLMSNSNSGYFNNTLDSGDGLNLIVAGPDMQLVDSTANNNKSTSTSGVGAAGAYKGERRKSWASNVNTSAKDIESDSLADLMAKARRISMNSKNVISTSTTNNNVSNDISVDTELASPCHPSPHSADVARIQPFSPVKDDPELPEVDSRENLNINENNEIPRIKKTTSMARFYYRNSQSDDDFHDT